MFHKAVIVTLAVFVFCANAVLAEEIDVDKIDGACNSTVVINGDKINPNPNAGSRESTISFNGVGAGVIVDPRGYIITNYHVIEGIRKIQVKTYDGQEYIGQYISHDPATDIALIKITPHTPLKPIVIGDSSNLRRLKRVVVTGHPFGYSFSTNTGEISGLCREVPVKNNLSYINMIQISAGINPGNSGGPLLTTDGEMIGVNSALRTDANQIAFAIPVDYVMEVGAELFRRYTSQYCYHGIRFKEVDVNLIGTPNINVNDYKVLAIDSIEPGSPAEEAGLQPGDVLQSAGELHLDRKLDLQRSLVDKKDGDIIHLVFERSGSQYETNMVLRNPKNRGINNRLPERMVAANKENADYVWNTFGLRGAPVTQEEFLRRNTGMKSKYAFDGAVEITDVKKGSVFAFLEIQKGDLLAGIITPNGDWNITRIDDLRYLGERWSPEEMGGDQVVVLVIRNQAMLEGRIPVVKGSLANSAGTMVRK